MHNTFPLSSSLRGCLLNKGTSNLPHFLNSHPCSTNHPAPHIHPPKRKVQNQNTKKHRVPSKHGCAHDHMQRRHAMLSNDAEFVSGEGGRDWQGAQRAGLGLAASERSSRNLELSSLGSFRVTASRREGAQDVQCPLEAHKTLGLCSFCHIFTGELCHSRGFDHSRLTAGILGAEPIKTDFSTAPRRQTLHLGASKHKTLSRALLDLYSKT